MDIHHLVNLTARAWCLEILACLARGTPGRQAPLLAATGAGRTAFRDSLNHLIDLGLLARTPGHGHPLRPEFRLTSTGREAAAMADRILAIPQPGGGTLLRLSWTLPILALTGTPQRFSGLRAGLGRITDRALSVRLKGLEAEAWLLRDIDIQARPPMPTYRAINQGLRIIRAIIG